MESLYDVWGKRNPQWETRYQKSIMDVFTDYGRGTTRYQSVRGKTFGAGYEAFILAFFIGLYYDQAKPLVQDKDLLKTYGQPIQYWGNQETRVGRTSYGQIRQYIFAALIARTDVDLIALDKGETTVRKVVDLLIEKMEQYANFGFSFMTEKMDSDPNFFFKETAFLHVFLSFLKKDDGESETDEPEEL